MNVLRKMSIVPVALVAMYAFSLKPAVTPLTGDEPFTVVEDMPVFNEESAELSQDTQLLEEVVVVGVGAQRKVSVVAREDVQVKNQDAVKTETDEEPLSFVEQMPEFPGGEEALRKFLSNNVVYPKEAKEKGIKGTIYLSFIVEKDGSISDVKVMRGIDSSCDAEALRVVNLMPNWKPGKQGGKEVYVKFTMPIKFELRNNETVTPTSSEAEGQAAVKTETDEEPYTFVEEMPQFNDKPSYKEDFDEFLSKNLVYPPEAKENGIKGTVYILFVVEKDGSISDAKVIRGIDSLCDAEALRLINSMPKWKPGKQNGKEVRVKFAIPIKFTLSQ